MMLKMKDHLYHYRSDRSLLVKKLLQTGFYVIVVPFIIFWFVFSNPNPLRASSLSPSRTGVSQDYAHATPSTPQTTKSKSCDYTDGNWVPTTTPPLYNTTTCGQTIRNRQNCIYNGRPDLTYLYWRWKPKPTTCNFPPTFSPSTFLNSFPHKHFAFIGDSIARNQVESLICLLSTSSIPKLIYSYPDTNPKFRRWKFPSHNITVSVYWSPFLVNGIERSTTMYYNTMFLNSIDETWAKDLPGMDTIVLSIGHWFHYQGVYYENGSVIGSHGCETLNHTEIGFQQVFRKAYRTAFNTIINRRRRTSTSGSGVEVVVTTFMPQHFDSDDWGKLDSCSRTKPFEASEVEIEGVTAEMRRITLEEVEETKKKILEEEEEGGVRVTGLDITKLSLLRPDGHPGPYMNRFPFENGVKDRVQNDCLHFCLPGAIDTWNLIMFELISHKR